MTSLLPPSASIRAASTILIGFAGFTLWRLIHVVQSEPIDAQPSRVIISRDRFGQTTRTDYVSVITAALTGRSAFIGAQVNRTYSDVEQIRRTVLSLTSDAAIVHRYAATYPIGFDLRPGRVAVKQSGSGLLITLDKPRLMSPPGVRFLGHEVLAGGLFVDEDAQVIAFQRRQLDVAARRGGAIAADPAVLALCEQRLAAFLRAFLSKQPGAGPPPTIRFAYR